MCENPYDEIITAEGYMDKAAQEQGESARHIHQQTNGGAEPKLSPRCLITGCCDDAEPTSVFCAWHNIGRQLSA